MPAKTRSPRVPAPPARRGQAKSRKKATKRVRPSSDAILEAAESVFARQGFGDTSLRQLMSTAGVSTTAFYARFPSREAVLEELIVRFLERLGADAAAQLSQSRGVEQGFVAGTEVLVASVTPRKPLVRLLLSEAAASPSVRGALNTAYGQLADLLGANLQRLVDRGDIEIADARSIGWALVGAIKIQLERWAVFGELDDDSLAIALASTTRALLPVIRKRRN